MIKPSILFSLILIAIAWAQEEIGSLVSHSDEGREDLLFSGQIGGLATIRFADLGTFTYNKGIFVQEARIRPLETKGYKAQYTADVSKVIVGIEYRNDEYEANAFLEVNLKRRINPFLRGSVNTDTECRAEKVAGSANTDSVFCAFDTSSKGAGTVYIWVTGKRFTTYNMYVTQDSDRRH